ncbi:hypothetical protein CASFOL_022309 [Castilleja foliolosa]|uniref:Protein BIG GRAIN 1-like B n=1 Tax=Castilleja foliolosa TaxID=1961234 RepID=A0ABD3CVQ8_9LAMI
MYYSTDKPYYKPRKHHNNTPSFSSTLLDEIYNSIDGNEKKANGLKVFDEKPLRKQMSSVRSEESTAKVKVAVRRRISLMSELEKSALQERDLFFFSSTNQNAEFLNSKGTNKPKVTSSCLMSDDPGRNKTGNDLTIKTKSNVYNKVYANLKKVKQPISPGGKLTSFINSLFANSNDKKSKKLEKEKVVVQQVQDPSSKSRVEMRDGLRRMVGFHHNGKPPLPPSSIIEGAAIAKHVFRGDDDDDDDDNDDGFSDASSDLFELDHKVMFGKSRFCEELPVYETAYFVKNRLN